MYKLASKTQSSAQSAVTVAGVTFGAGGFTMIAGPCAIESRAQIQSAAEFIAMHGGHMLRGGAYKPRTSPYAFQGLGDEGVRYIAQAKESAGIPCVVEVLSEAELPMLCA